MTVTIVAVAATVCVSTNVDQPCKDLIKMAAYPSDDDDNDDDDDDANSNLPASERVTGKFEFSSFGIITDTCDRHCAVITDARGCATSQ